MATPRKKRLYSSDLEVILDLLRRELAIEIIDYNLEEGKRRLGNIRRRLYVLKDSRLISKEACDILKAAKTHIYYDTFRICYAMTITNGEINHAKFSNGHFHQDGELPRDSGFYNDLSFLRLPVEVVSGILSEARK